MIDIKNSRFPGCTSSTIQQVKNFGEVGVNNAPKEYKDYYVHSAILVCGWHQEPREYAVNFWVLGIVETEESNELIYLVVDDATCTYRGKADTSGGACKIGDRLEKTDLQ
jgi:hypothetical protein